MVYSPLAETWALYSIGSIAIFLRTFVRVRLVGVSGFDVDDYLVWFGWGCYTAMTVAAHIVGGTGDTSKLTDEQRINMSPTEAASRQLGTKWFLVGWYTYVGLLWSLKLNMLFLYRRVAGRSVAWVSKVIMPTMIFVVASAVSIWILLSSACRPFHKLWQIYPDPGPYCFPQSNTFLITILTLNLTSDLILILIPIPIIAPLQISTGRKFGLIVLFTGGIFTMTAAILRVYFVVVQESGATAAIWSCREDVVAIVIGQGTFLKSLFSPSFWGRESLLPKSLSDAIESKRSNNGASGSGSRSTELVTIGAKSSRSKNVRNPYSLTALDTRNMQTRSESEEKIIEDRVERKSVVWEETTEGPKTPNAKHGGISVQTTVDQAFKNVSDEESRTDPFYNSTTTAKTMH